MCLANTVATLAALTVVTFQTAMQSMGVSPAIEMGLGMNEPAWVFGGWAYLFLLGLGVKHLSMRQNVLYLEAIRNHYANAMHIDPNGTEVDPLEYIRMATGAAAEEQEETHDQGVAMASPSSKNNEGDVERKIRGPNLKALTDIERYVLCATEEDYYERFGGLRELSPQKPAIIMMTASGSAQHVHERLSRRYFVYFAATTVGAITWILDMRYNTSILKQFGLLTIEED